MRLHVVMWLWQGWRPVYDRRHVMAQLYLLRRYAALPDTTRYLLIREPRYVGWRVDGLDEFHLWDPPAGLPAVKPGQAHCWTRLKLWDPAMQAALGIEPGDIVMGQDLDAVWLGSPMGALAHLIAGDTFVGMAGRVSRVHGAWYAFRAGKHSNLWTDFDPVKSPKDLKRPVPGTHHQLVIGSDQAWMSHKLPRSIPLMRREEGFMSYGRHGFTARERDFQVYWSFAGPHKPWSEAVYQSSPWLWKAYQEAWANI